MNTRRTLVTPLICGLVAVMGLHSEAALARGPAPGGGHFAVGHAPSFGASRGFSGYSGFRGSYGPSYYRGGYHGGGWGLGLGLGLGLFVASLPLYYSTVWWDHTPYYYADNTYYRYNTAVGQYETVAPPSGVQPSTAATTQGSDDLFAYPKNGQSDEQQAKDKFDCYSWARSQTGFDPVQPGSGNRTEYLRAQTACLEGRGYSVR